MTCALATPATLIDAAAKAAMIKFFIFVLLPSYKKTAPALYY